MRALRELVIHHSASPRDRTTVETIDEAHRNRPRDPFDMIGYHLVIEASGQLRVGRPIWRFGAHCPPFNRSSIGLCVVGDNTKPDQAWNARQLETLDQVVRVLALTFDLEVHGHRDIGETPTLCPGLDVVPLLQSRGSLP